MTSAIIIIISILFISVALFFVIKKMAAVSKDSLEEYEESSLIEYDSILNMKDPLEVSSVNNSKMDKNNVINSIFLKFKLILGGFYKNLRSQIFINLEKYKDSQRKKQIEREKVIREAFIKEENKVRLENNLSKEHQDENIDLDNEFLEKPNKTKSFVVEESKKNLNNNIVEIEEKIEFSSTQEFKEVNYPENKVDSFVEQLLEESYFEEDIPNRVLMNEDVNDSYYYKYMEKRYINKIVKNPRDITAYRKLGDLYYEMKNYTDSIESYKMVLKLKPEDIAIKNKLKKIQDLL